MNLFDLTGRLAVVTGCRRGIGLAMAEALAGAGADIIGVSATLEPRAARSDDARPALGRQFTPYRVDLADRSAVTTLAARLAGAAGRSTSWSTTPAPSAGPRPPSTATRTGTTCSRST